jgi:hypothetical protein
VLYPTQLSGRSIVGLLQCCQHATRKPEGKPTMNCMASFHYLLEMSEFTEEPAERFNIQQSSLNNRIQNHHASRSHAERRCLPLLHRSGGQQSVMNSLSPPRSWTQSTDRQTLGPNLFNSTIFRPKLIPSQRLTPAKIECPFSPYIHVLHTL